MSSRADPGISAVAQAGLDAAAIGAGYRRARRRDRWIAFAFVAPLVAFLLVNFALPVGLILARSVDDQETSAILIRSSPLLAAWESDGIPSEAAIGAFIADLRDARDNRKVSALGARLNAARPGFQALISKTSRELGRGEPRPSLEALTAIDARWSERDTWLILRQASHGVTALHLLAAVDLTMTPSGAVVATPEDQSNFRQLWVRTFWMSLVVCVACALLGYPLAYWMANASSGVASILVILVLMPFWTSILVRTTAWVALLQNQGVVNDLLVGLGLVDQRLQLVRNRTGVYITMVHVLLPFMVLPLYSVMARVPKTYLRAAASLGARPIVAFYRIYLPQTIHAVGSGMALIFILSVGFYITPALVGGRNDQMISFFIAYFTTESLNWSAAAALAVVLLIFTAVCFAAFSRIFGLNRIKLAG